MRKWAIIAGLFLSGILSAEEGGDYRQLPFNPADPLCSVSIASIIQDSHGYIWFGTQDGLDRYDGYETLHIKMPSDCAGYGNVRSLCEDDENNIWIGSFKGICVWEAKTQRIRKYSEGAIANMVKSGDGAIWVAANYAGFLRIDPVTGNCDTLSFQYHNASAHYGEYVCYDGDRTLWFLNGVGAIYKCDIDSREMEMVFPHWNSPLAGIVTRIFWIDGYLCGGRINRGSFLYDTLSGEMTSEQWGTVFCAGDEGKFILTSRGLLHFPRGLRAYVYGDAPVRTLSTTEASAACLDRDGSFWLGTGSGGVFRLLPDKYDFKTVTEGHITAFTEGPDGAVWIADQEKGLMRYAPEEPGPATIQLPLRDGVITALGVVGSELLISTTSPKTPAFLFKPESGRAKVLNYFPIDLRVLCDRGGGKLWGGGWLYDIDLEAGTAVRVERVRTGLSDAKRDKKGRWWLGTSFSGMWMEDGGEWTHYTDAEGIVMRTNALYVDKKDRVWICSPDDGLQMLDPQTGETRIYSEFGAAARPRIVGIAEDAEGVFYLATPKGLATLNPDTGNSAHYNLQEFQGSGQSSLSAVKTIGKYLYAISPGSILRFDPVSFRKVNTAPGRIVFTGLDLPGRLGRNEMGSLPDRLMDINSRSRLRLRAKENSFILGVSQMDYSVPRSSRLEFRLDGDDNQWIRVDNGKITVTNLPSGQYRLTVRVVGRDGAVLVDSRTLYISVARPLMASIPAIFVYILLLGGGILLVAQKSQQQAYKKAKEAARVQEAEREKQIYASKVEFLTTIAHEIRTPLTLVKAPVETLQSRLAHSADKSVIEELDVVGRNADKLSVLLDELLDLGKLESSGITLNPAEYEIDAIVRSVVGRFSLAARRRHIDIKLSLPQEALLASVDKNAFDKIISNLLSNAIKYCRSTVSVTLSADGDILRLVTENDGDIVPLDRRERIFRPFERYVPDGSVETGTGIGLYVCRNLAQLHGGTLSMDADQTVNRFILTIPIVHIVEENTPVTLPDVYIPKEQPTVLIVEDNEDMLDFIRRQFGEQYSVLTATNGKEALQTLKDNPLSLPDCVISDVMMPEMDGFELCRQLKADDRTSHIPVILLTARADMDSRIIGLEKGADAYVSKPFSAGELLSQVDNLLKNRERLRRKFSSSITDYSALAHSSPDAQLLRTIDTYIHAHLRDESLSVEALAAEACVSTSTLFKKTKSMLGMGPNDYILLVRLKQSSELLRSTSLPISEVAEQTGFRSPSYFSSCFKAQFGVTPKEYRSRQ